PEFNKVVLTDDEIPQLRAVIGLLQKKDTYNDEENKFNKDALRHDLEGKMALSNVTLELVTVLRENMSRTRDFKAFEVLITKPDETNSLYQKCKEHFKC